MKKSMKFLLSVTVFTVFVLNIHLSLESVDGLILPTLKIEEAKATNIVCFHNAVPQPGGMTNFCSSTMCVVSPGFSGSAMYRCGGDGIPQR